MIVIKRHAYTWKTIQKRDNMNKSVYVFFLFSCVSVNACPFIIFNDSPHYLLVVNPNQKKDSAVRIVPKHSKTIDATVKGWWKWVMNETLNIYVEKEERETFNLKYQLIEKYCPNDDDANKLKLSEIIKIAYKPDKRLRVRVFDVDDDDD